MSGTSDDPIVFTRKKQDAGYGSREHFHGVYEFYYLISGNRKIFVEDTLYNISKGDLVLIPKNSMHHVAPGSDRDFERICLRFTDDCLGGFIEEFGQEEVREMLRASVVNIPLNRRKAFESLMDSIGDCIQNRDEFSRIQLRCYAGNLIIGFLRIKKAMKFNIPQDLKGVDRVMQRAASYIVEHFKENITLSEVSSFVNMSETYFSKKFKETTGFGFKEYLLALRIKHACELLLNTNDSITEIAYNSGFNDSNYFGDVFKRLKGISPLQYRKRKEFV